MSVDDVLKELTARILCLGFAKERNKIPLPRTKYSTTSWGLKSQVFFPCLFVFLVHLILFVVRETLAIRK